MMTTSASVVHVDYVLVQSFMTISPSVVHDDYKS